MGPNPDGSFMIFVANNGLAAQVALYVTLTTLAAGYFLPNSFILHQPIMGVVFVPYFPGQGPLLNDTLRVEHLAAYQSEVTIPRRAYKAL